MQELQACYTPPTIQRLAVFMLTEQTVYQKGASPNATLGFDIKASDDCESKQTGNFVIWVPDLGESYGRSDPIQASKKSTYPHFSIGNDGSVYPQLTAASQGWYGKSSATADCFHLDVDWLTMIAACNITVQGESYWGLSWGVYNSNGSAPYGCVNTSVKQNFNIPCSF
jgi:hypothetical protein